MRRPSFSGRVKQFLFAFDIPKQFRPDGPNPARKVVTPTYDVAGRIKGLKVNDINYVSQINFDAASQITSPLVGTGTTQLNENYKYDFGSGLLTKETVQRGVATQGHLCGYDLTSYK